MNGIVNVSVKKEVAASALLDDFIETRFIDWKCVRVPLCDSGGVDIDDGNFDVWALVGDDGARGAVKQVIFG